MKILPRIFKSRRRKSAEKQYRVRKDAKDRHRKVTSNGHVDENRGR